MQNTLANYDRIAKAIEDAVVAGSGYAASEAANTIDREFILIKKSDLPPVTGKPHPWRDNRTPMARTAGYNGRSAKIYWNRALDFISVALYAEQQEAEKASRELDWKRNEAYNMLYPTATPLSSYDAADLQVKTKIDVVVNLMRQVDELKATK